jgi:hypothetical protein
MPQRIALQARVTFRHKGQVRAAGEVFTTDPIDAVVLRTRGVVRWAPKTPVPTGPRNPPMTRCAHCGQAADDCGGRCRGARAARNDPHDHKSRAALDAQQAEDAPPAEPLADRSAAVAAPDAPQAADIEQAEWSSRFPGTTCPCGPEGPEGPPGEPDPLATPTRTYQRRDLTADS